MAPAGFRKQVPLPTVFERKTLILEDRKWRRKTEEIVKGRSGYPGEGDRHIRCGSFFAGKNGSEKRSVGGLEFTHGDIGAHDECGYGGDFYQQP